MKINHIIYVASLIQLLIKHESKSVSDVLEGLLYIPQQMEHVNVMLDNKYDIYTIQTDKTPSKVKTEKYPLLIQYCNNFHSTSKGVFE